MLLRSFEKKSGCTSIFLPTPRHFTHFAQVQHDCLCPCTASHRYNVVFPPPLSSRASGETHLTNYFCKFVSDRSGDSSIALFGIIDCSLLPCAPPRLRVAISTLFAITRLLCCSLGFLPFFSSVAIEFPELRTAAYSLGGKDYCYSPSTINCSLASRLLP